MDRIAASKPRARYLPLGVRLEASLARDPIWAAADAALSRNLRPDIRDDVIANMIVAHLEGALSTDDFPSRASEFRLLQLASADLRRLFAQRRPTDADLKEAFPHVAAKTDSFY